MLRTASIPTHVPDAVLTLTEATQLHRTTAAAGLWPTWIVSDDDPAFPGRHVARVHTMDHHGGVWLPGVLVATTLAELVAVLPPGLTREGRGPLDPPGVLETWC